MGRRAGASITIARGTHPGGRRRPRRSPRQVDLARHAGRGCDGQDRRARASSTHTHLVFGGSRAPEYAARMTRTPAEVRALGIPIGIQATVA